jgi:hypothetical protein
MTPERTPDPDAALSTLLQSWRVASPLPPGFSARVWQRIAQPGPATVVTPGAALRQWLDDLFRRPAWSVAAALLLLGAGVGGGYWQARERTRAWDREMADRYMQAVSPYAQPHASAQ